MCRGNLVIFDICTCLDYRIVELIVVTFEILFTNVSQTTVNVFLFWHLLLLFSIASKIKDKGKI